MIPDLRQMTVTEIERLLIKNAVRAREIGGGKVTFDDITTAIGIAHDPEQVACLKNKMSIIRCIQKSGKYLTFLVETVEEPDEELIKNDPTLSLMNEIFDIAIKPSPERDITLHVTDDINHHPCKVCVHFNKEDGTCGQKKKPVDGDAIKQDCDDFTIDMERIGYNKKTWYKKQGSSRRR